MICFSYLFALLSILSTVRSLSFPYNHVLVVGSGSLPILTSKLSYYAGVPTVDCLISSAVEEEGAAMMFRDGFKADKDGDGFITNAPKDGDDRFGEDR